MADTDVGQVWHTARHVFVRRGPGELTAMDATRFDGLARSFSQSVPRRRAAVLLSAVGLGVLAGGPAILEAKKNKKKKKKKLKRNDFGCVNVGGKCRGKDNNCCSGICQGKKPKKGEKDKSKCKAHDESTCLAGQTEPICGGIADTECVASDGEIGECFTTTGNAAYCARDGDCFPCKKDADCIGVCGPSAACVPCAEECAETGGTACLGAADGSCSI
jgi:hypothetical protein